MDTLCLIKILPVKAWIFWLDRVWKGRRSLIGDKLANWNTGLFILKKKLSVLEFVGIMPWGRFEVIYRQAGVVGIFCCWNKTSWLRHLIWVCGSRGGKSSSWQQGAGMTAETEAENSHLQIQVWSRESKLEVVMGSSFESPPTMNNKAWLHATPKPPKLHHKPYQKNILSKFF